MKHTKYPIRGILACLLAILIFVFIFPSDVQAATQGNYTYTTANGAATITKCSTSASGKITLPNTLGGYPVTAIGASAFSGCTRLTEVIIPAGVTSIGSSAFNGCTKLAQVTIPDSVTSIGTKAFYGCTALNSVTIPGGVMWENL